MEIKDLLMAHIENYWDIAYQHGADGRDDDDEFGAAQMVLHSIQSTVDYMNQRIKDLEEQNDKLMMAHELNMKELEPPTIDDLMGRGNLVDFI